MTTTQQALDSLDQNAKMPLLDRLDNCIAWFILFLVRNVLIVVGIGFEAAIFRRNRDRQVGTSLLKHQTRIATAVVSCSWHFQLAAQPLIQLALRWPACPTRPISA